MVFLPLAGLALGAAGMYLFDPEQGRRRRALMRDKVNSQSRQWRDATSAGMTDLRNRAHGASRQMWSSMAQDRVPDRVLVERVRSKIGRHVSHPGAIRVQARDGTIVLDGSVMQQEADELLRIVRRVRGVQDVEDRLQRQAQEHAMPSAASPRPGGLHVNFLQPDWTPATRMASGTAGTMLVMMGLRRRGLFGMVSSLAGAAMLVRAAANRPLAEVAGQFKESPRRDHGQTTGPDVGSTAGAAQDVAGSEATDADTSPATRSVP